MEQVQFDSLFEIPTKNGLSRPSRVRGSGYKMINMGELFANDRIYDIPMELVPMNEKEKLINDIREDDLLFARQSLVLSGAGKCSIVKEVKEYTTFESHLIRVRLNKEIANPNYYYYYFKSPYSPIKSIVQQCAQSGIRASELATLKVCYIPLEQQQKIAGILSAYDDLIEINRKQIKLLEEAAQKLYKEWFVKLNFPGHENVKIVDGVPEGWKKGVLSDIGEFKRGKTITKDQTAQGSVPVVAGGLEPAYYHNDANTETPVITVSGSGANAGFTRLYYEKVWASDCSFLDISKCENLYFIYCVLKSSTDLINNLQKGAAQPHVYAKDLNALQVVIPIDIVFDNFSKVVSPYFDKIKSLQNQIQLLQSARDKLLPRLMNGDINA